MVAREKWKKSGEFASLSFSLKFDQQIAFSRSIWSGKNPILRGNFFCEEFHVTFKKLVFQLYVFNWVSDANSIKRENFKHLHSN